MIQQYIGRRRRFCGRVHWNTALAWQPPEQWRAPSINRSGEHNRVKQTEGMIGIYFTRLEIQRLFAALHKCDRLAQRACAHRGRVQSPPPVSWPWRIKCRRRFANSAGRGGGRCNIPKTRAPSAPHPCGVALPRLQVETPRDL